ncbi:MAG: hypothetical protein R3F49_12915 [Planctomycetota bacterium]
MKKLLTALSLATALASATFAAESVTTGADAPAPVIGTAKPGWGAGRVLVARRNTTKIIEASGTSDALALPRVKRHSGMSKPGFGVRR